MREYSHVTADEAETRIRELLSERNFYRLDFDGVWLKKVLEAYRQPHRYFHTLTHLLSIFESIRENEWADEENAAQMMLTALFHDVVWYPQGNDSEQRSVQVFEFLMAQLGEPLPAKTRHRASSTWLVSVRSSTRNASASQAGAVVAARPSTVCSAILKYSRRASPSPLWQTSGSTTPSIRSAT